MKTQKITLDTQVIEYDKDKNIIKDYIVGKKVDHYENTIDIDINNSDGSIDRKIKMPFNSFVQNFLTILRYRFLDLGNPNGGYTNGLNFARTDIPTSTLVGIIVGSSSASFSVSGTGLMALIPNTTLTYYITNVRISLTGNITTLEISRVIKNNTATTINIKEIGLMANTKCYWDDGGSELCARDINDSNGVPINIDFLAGQSMTIKYNISVNSNEGLLYNFLDTFKSQSPFTDSAYNITTLTGLSTSIPYNYRGTPYCFLMYGNNALYGVMAGSGITPVTAMDYKLEALIPDSLTGLTYINYNLISAITVVGNTTSFTIQKTFTNNSTANITINEAGLYTQGNGGDNRICIARRLITPMVVVPTHMVDIKFILSTTL